MRHHTTIDTVGIRIECDNPDNQRELLLDLQEFVSDNNTVNLSTHDIQDTKPYHRASSIYCRGTTIATIETGSYRAGTAVNGYRTIYCISITFAGLKRYDDILDQVAYNLLTGICYYLNVHGIAYKLTELDVCIDVECPFKHVMAVCTQKYPKTDYYSPMDVQHYDATAYIERLSKEQMDNVVCRAYLYDKTYKEKLDRNITRFELKFQHRFFQRHGFDFKAILKALERYHVMYFNDPRQKQVKAAEYNNDAAIRHREVKRVQFDKYRLLPDVAYLADFLFRIRPYHPSLANTFS